ncbi:c-type cytochrome [Novosphingobium indicum]|uniref:c-type cytochrome n=1 Tax=Novosphingobium indicum TaxID=462949 RepID=UPI001667BE4A|nr:c-type cytochrome [Novosphingobium indicum]
MAIVLAAFGATGIAASIAGPSVSAQSPASLEAGRIYFRNNCAACHSVEPGKESGFAPNLFGLGGRLSGSGPGGGSKALVDAKIAWNQETLQSFLADPAGLAPGTSMVISVTNPGDRSALVFYLLSSK